MDVTRSNFKEHLEAIKSSISEASFLSLDGEFTGISHGKGIHAFDTPEERYVKLKEGASNFLLVQFGLCTFHYDQTQKKYTHRAFNFYLFPRQFKRTAPDCRFLCQASSLDFLATQGFDFNKLINEGISYLTPANEEKLRTEIAERHESFKQHQTNNSPSCDSSAASRTPIAIPPEHKDYINNVCAKIDLLLESRDDSIELAPANRFIRKLIYQTGKSKYNNSVHLETKPLEKDSRLASIIVTKISSEDKLKELDDARLREELDELNDAVGFSKIIRMISQSKKLVIGHNMLLDLLLSINQFSCPLPENYDDFKSLARCIFPNLLDTKLMASLPPFKERFIGTALGDLQKQLSQKPFSQPDVGFSPNFGGYTIDKARLHEAGYDAFITGICFITMCNFLGSLQDPPVESVSSGSVLLESYLNKIFLLRVQDIPYMNLAGDEVSVNRDHVFHLTFPKEWKTSDIHQLFVSYGAIYIAWIDDTSAFVALKQSLEVPSNVIQSLGQSDTYNLTTYREYSNKKKGVPIEVKKPLPVSDVDLASYKRKRKSSIESAKAKRSIETIPEEDEIFEQPTEKKKRCDDEKQRSPVKKKIFEEAESWEN